MACLPSPASSPRFCLRLDESWCVLGLDDGQEVGMEGRLEGLIRRMVKN